MIQDIYEVADQTDIWVSLYEVTCYLIYFIRSIHCLSMTMAVSFTDGKTSDYP